MVYCILPRHPAAWCNMAGGKEQGRWDSWEQDTLVMPATWSYYHCTGRNSLLKVTFFCESFLLQFLLLQHLVAKFSQKNKAWFSKTTYSLCLLRLQSFCIYTWQKIGMYWGRIKAGIKNLIFWKLMQSLLLIICGNFILHGAACLMLSLFTQVSLGYCY